MYIDFQQAVEAYMPSLYRLAYSYCLNRSDAEDVVQEVFMSYLQRPPQCDGPARLRAWLMTATANKCKTVFVLPPMAISNVIAFRNASRVAMFRGNTFSSPRS